MRVIFLAALTVCILLNASAQRKQLNIDNNWKFAFGHAANPEKDFNYSIKTIFSKSGGALEPLSIHGLTTAAGARLICHMIGQRSYHL